jgi:uncharacterized protein
LRTGALMTQAAPPERPDPQDVPTARLSPGVRLLLLAAGWLLLLIGIAGLVLPGIQGVLTIALAIALLSVASQRAHRVARRLFARWPRLLDRMDRFRDKLHERLSRSEEPPSNP